MTFIIQDNEPMTPEEFIEACSKLVQHPFASVPDPFLMLGFYHFRQNWLDGDNSDPLREMLKELTKFKPIQFAALGYDFSISDDRKHWYNNCVVLTRERRPHMDKWYYSVWFRTK